MNQKGMPTQDEGKSKPTRKKSNSKVQSWAAVACSITILRAEENAMALEA